MLGRSNSNCNHRDPQTSRPFVLTSAHPSSPIPPSPLMPGRLRPPFTPHPGPSFPFPRRCHARPLLGAQPRSHTHRLIWSWPHIHGPQRSHSAGFAYATIDTNAFSCPLALSPDAEILLAARRPSPSCRSPFQVPSSKHQSRRIQVAAARSLSLARGHSSATIRRLQQKPPFFSASPPFSDGRQLRTRSSFATTWRGRLTGARACTARRAPQVPRSFHLPASFVQPSSCPAGSRSQAPLSVLSPRLTQCCTSGSRRLAHGLPQSRGRVALHARCIFLAAQRGSPCVCTYGYNTCERASERHPETQKETRVRSRNMVKSCSWRWHGHGYDPVWAHDHVHLPVHLAGRHLPGLEDLLAQRQRDCRRACVRVRAGVK